MPASEVQAFLEALPMSDRLRAAAWDAVYAEGDDSEIERRITALPVDEAVKAQLWDYAHGDYSADAQPEGSAIGRFASNAAAMLNPVTIAKGLYQTVRHPIDTTSAIIDLQKQQFEKANQAQSPVEAGAHRVAGLLPVLGPLAANAGEQMATGDVAGGLGTGAGLLTTVAAGPAVTRAVGRKIGKTAVPMARSALKPTITAMRRQVGATVAGLDSKANQLVQFIVDNGITTPAQAERIIARVEGQIQSAARGATRATDAPQRAQRYLSALERSAQRQGLPSDDVATIRAKAAELLNESPLSETVPTMGPPPMGSQMAGNTVPVPATTRALRTDVMPDEALALARGSGKWGNRKSWGEQKGAAREASKAVERAERDAVKAAVPEAKPLLQQQGKAIQAKEALDRMTFREGNREPVSPFDVTTAAVEIGTGNAPVLSIARHVLRQNKLKMGVWARRLERAIQQNDEAAAAAILDRFGVARTAATAQPSQRPATATP